MKATATVDGVDTTKMNREQLEFYVHKILEEMEREREERNFFQLERDKIRTFWEITRHQLDEAQATVRYYCISDCEFDILIKFNLYMLFFKK